MQEMDDLALGARIESARDLVAQKEFRVGDELHGESESAPLSAGQDLDMAVRDGGTGPLFDDLHQIFKANFPVQETHKALAELCATMRRAGQVSNCPIMLTVNYDDMVDLSGRPRPAPTRP